MQTDPRRPGSWEALVVMQLVCLEHLKRAQWDLNPVNELATPIGQYSHFPGTRSPMQLYGVAHYHTSRWNLLPRFNGTHSHTLTDKISSRYQVAVKPCLSVLVISCRGVRPLMLIPPYTFMPPPPYWSLSTMLKGWNLVLRSLQIRHRRESESNGIWIHWWIKHSPILLESNGHVHDTI